MGQGHCVLNKFDVHRLNIAKSKMRPAVRSGGR